MRDVRAVRVLLQTVMLPGERARQQVRVQTTGMFPQEQAQQQIHVREAAVPPENQTPQETARLGAQV